MLSPDGLSCSPPNRRLLQRQRRSCSIILVDLEVPMSSIPTKDLVQLNNILPQRIQVRNGIVERANQEVLRHLRALLFDSRVQDKWSFEQLPLVQRIMNTVEKISVGVTPADLMLSHLIRLTSHIMSPVNSHIDSSDTRQHTLLVVAKQT